MCERLIYPGSLHGNALARIRTRDLLIASPAVRSVTLNLANFSEVAK